MYFKIEKKIASVRSGIYTGVVVAYGINNANTCMESERLLKESVEEFLRVHGEKRVQDFDEIRPYNEAMDELGVNYLKYPCSIVSILSRIQKKREFPSMGPAIDLGNYISIHNMVPVGVHDIDTLDKVLSVRLSNSQDCNEPNNQFSDDKLVEGEPVYISGDSVRTRRWLWRQTPIGRVTKDSKNFVFLIDGFESNKDRIESAVNELSHLIETIFNIKCEVGFVTKEVSEFRFGPMTEEEKKIEDQIAIMLKGVAQYTAVPQIRERIISANDNGRPLRVKLGLDPSAPDIHLGHTVVLRKIRQLQDMGHKAIIIIGDYTGMIGDPTGKSKTRKQLSHDDVVRNAQTYMDQIFKIIDRNKTEVYYNSEWLSKMTFSDVIQLASKCTVARMLERDDFNNRYTNHLPLSVHEFFYPLMQAYDSVATRADIEIGGTDQTFNILMGRNIQKDYGQEPQLTLFMPLLEGTDGVEKMSKSLGNYIGINEAPDVIYEKVMKIPDFLIIKYYNLCTDIHPDKVKDIQNALNRGDNPRDIKMQLASVITELYCGKDAAESAESHFKLVFQKKAFPDDAPVIEINKSSDYNVGEQIVSLLVEKGFYKSKGEVRRIFSQGGARVNDVIVHDIKDINPTSASCELKMGKNKFFRVVLQ